MGNTHDYYSEDVRYDIDHWPLSLRARYTKLTERMTLYGGNLGEPHTSAFGNGPFELRVKGNEGFGRVFFCPVVGKRIMMLQSYIKKTRKTPRKGLSIAEARLRGVKNER